MPPALALDYPPNTGVTDTEDICQLTSPYPAGRCRSNNLYLMGIKAGPTMALSPNTTPLVLPVNHIIPWGTYPEMRGIHTCRIIALMAYNHSFRYGTIKILIRHTVRLSSLSLYSDTSITPPKSPSGPFPTTFRALIVMLTA